jgi:hypothetical protein
VKAKLRFLYAQGQITRKDYLLHLARFNKILIAKFRTLKKKSLSYVDGVRISEEGSKIVQLSKNTDDLRRIVANKAYYSRNDDPDYLLANGNYAEALKMKRARA